MKAFHSFWSLPNRIRNGGVIRFPDYELLTMMLSALEWRRCNGPIRMLTDREGLAFFEQEGLSGLWSEPPEPLLDDIGGEFDPMFFWAAGKLFALRQVPAPCVMLDTDLILWKNVEGRLSDAAVAAHREDLYPQVYPDPSVFTLDDSYAFPSEWDFTLPAANTAFLYLPDDGFRTRYTDAAFSFMRALRSRDVSPVVTMCFAEQRLLPMCAASQGVRLDYLLDENALNDQSLATHLWGLKTVLPGSAEQRVAYCLSCIRRILSDFPEWEPVLSRNPQLYPYLSGLR